MHSEFRTSSSVVQQLDNEGRELVQAKKMMKVMKEVESVKKDLSKLKRELASILEEKRRAEREALSYSSSVKALAKEIEEMNEEHVVVELARIEALKELREIEDQRMQYSSMMERRKTSIAREIEDAKEVETKLAVTLSDIKVLQSELYQAKLHFHEDNEFVTGELEAKKKELASIESQRFELTTSMDVIRNELTRVVEETATLRKKEVAIQSLNSKLLRAKEKAANKAKLTAANLTLMLEQIKSECEAAEKEEALIREETDEITKQVEKAEIEIESREVRMQGAMEDLKAAKASEWIALEKLKAVIPTIMRNRGLSTQSRKTITISKFEYDYLKGNAAQAIEIAEKKVEAAEAWIEALNASEKEMEIRRESKEVIVEKDTSGKRAKARKSASSMSRGRSASFSMRRRR